MRQPCVRSRGWPRAGRAGWCVAAAPCRGELRWCSEIAGPRIVRVAEHSGVVAPRASLYRWSSGSAASSRAASLLWDCSRTKSRTRVRPGAARAPASPKTATIIRRCANCKKPVHHARYSARRACGDLGRRSPSRPSRSPSRPSRRSPNPCPSPSRNQSRSRSRSPCRPGSSATRAQQRAQKQI
jgi:hypothetical protein